MSRLFRLPELAESVVEGEIIKWLVAEGETVEADQPIVEVMTDKVTVELPSPFAGVLEKHLAQEGDVVAVDAPIAQFSADASGTAPDRADTAAVEAAEEAPGGVLADGAGSVQAAEERSIVEPGRPVAEDDGDSLSLFRASGPADEGPVVQVRKRGAPQPAAPQQPTPGAAGQPGPAQARATGPYGRVLAVPAARRLARELGIDIERVEGSGPNGRVRLDDVRAHADLVAVGGAPGRARSAPPATDLPGVHGSASAPAAAGAHVSGAVSTRGAGAVGTGGPAVGELEERFPVRGLRRAISQQMVASHLQTVRTLHVDEADVTNLVTMRERLKPLAERAGVKLSYLPFIMKAVVTALRAFPMINASLDEEKGEIVRKHYYNLGVAVATEVGLVVPVIHDVDRKSVLDLAQEVQAKAQRARDGKLTPEDVRGGTFSITNIGSLGGLFSFPIINVPEAAILGVHTIKKRPVVLEDDTIAARQMLYLSMSFDHRIIDGAEAAMFTSYLIELLETPESLMLSI